MEIQLNDRKYRMYWTPIGVGNNRENSKILVFLYFQDITEEMQMKAKYEEERSVIVLVHVDNFDEVMNNTDEAKRPVVQAQIEATLSEWAISLNAGWKKYERDKFVMITRADALKILEENRFQILDSIRAISAGNKIPVTLSVGVGADGKNPLELIQFAQSALDLALGRGGDQVVVKRGTRLYFYGGKSKEVEKRTKVKSRVIANNLRELMVQSNGVFIMGTRFRIWIHWALLWGSTDVPVMWRKRLLLF